MADATHAVHDPLSLAASIDGEGALGTAWTRACGACATLLGDLLAIRRAIPDAAVPARPRDFRLTAADAATLRRGRLGTWFAAIGTARDAVTRPVATSLVGLGLAGLLLGVIPTASVPAGVAGGPGVGITGEAPGAEGYLDPTIHRPLVGEPPRDTTGDPTAAPGATGTPDHATTGPASVHVVSAALLALGGMLFGLRRIAGNHRRREVV